MSIPKIIHLVEPGHNVLSVWQNTHPDWQCIEWSVEGCYAFLKRYYPASEEAYLRLTTPLQRVHFSWYYLLHRYGGVAVEGNRVPKKKIEGLFLSLYDLYLIEDWFIASAPNTDFLESALEMLPTLEPKWYDRFLGQRSLVRSTTTIFPNTAYKRHQQRVYQNYFYPVQSSSLSKIKIVLIGVLVFLVFQLFQIVRNKDKLNLWKLRFRILFPKKVKELSETSNTPDTLDTLDTLKMSTTSEMSITPKMSTTPKALKGIIPELDMLKNMSIASLEKGLLPSIHTPYVPQIKVPPIKIPPIDPPTPSSISFSPYSELTITPFAEDELEITI